MRIIQSGIYEAPTAGNGAENAQQISAPSSPLPNTSIPEKQRLSSEGLRLRISGSQPAVNRSEAPLPSRTVNESKGGDHVLV